MKPLTTITLAVLSIFCLNAFMTESSYAVSSKEKTEKLEKTKKKNLKKKASGRKKLTRVVG